MTTVQNGSKVTFHYKGTLEDGSEFDSSYNREEPMTTVAGQGNLIAGFENALSGMSEGESKTFTVEASEAYGERDPNATTELEKTIFPDDLELTLGMPVPLTGPGGQNFVATLTELKDTSIVVDLNHPLAGKDLTFEIEVLEVDENHE